MKMSVFGDLQLGAFKTSPAPWMHSDANQNFVLAYTPAFSPSLNMLTFSDGHNPLSSRRVVLLRVA